MDARFTHLLDFDRELGLYACEEIIEGIDNIIMFDHSKVIEHYDNEDTTYDVYMHFRADGEEMRVIINYLERKIPGRYAIYQRYY